MEERDEAHLANGFDVPTGRIPRAPDARRRPATVRCPGGVSGSDFLRGIHQAISGQDDFQPTFRQHPGAVLGGIASIASTFDEDVDLDYHLRRSALPAPGRVRDVLELTSRLHGTLLDRHRPLWEAHLIEGLSDGRFAVYVKFHHALIDGVSALKLTQRTVDRPERHRDSRSVEPAVETSSIHIG